MANVNHIYTDEQLARGKRKLRNYRRWKAENPRAWKFGEQYALNAYGAGQHVSGRAAIEQIRRHDFTDEHGQPTRTSNDYAAIIARVLIAEHPELADRMELRPCVFDVLMQGGGTDNE